MNLPKTNGRVEKYLSYLSGNIDIKLPVPIGREEQYLYYLCINGTGGGGGGTITVDSELSETSKNPVQNKVITSSLKELTQRVDDLSYVKITINSISATNNSNEIGSTVTASNVSWSLNRNPKTQKIKFGNEAEEVISNDLRIKYYTGKTIKTNTNIVLTVTDDRDATASKTTTISFMPKVYWGKTNKESLESADILALEGSALASNKAKTFTINAGVGEKIVYVIPTSFGTPTFTVGGFEGGFKKLQTLNHTNASGYSQNYDVWMSVNAGLGNTTVIVK